MIFQDEVILKNREEIQKLISKIHRKYKIKLAFDFLLLLFFALAKFIVPYLLIFSWWSGPLGFAIFIGLGLLIAGTSSIDQWKEYKEEMRLEEGRIHFDNDLSMKFSIFFQQKSAEIHPILKELGKDVEKEFFGINETRTTYLPNMIMPITKEIKVDNNERLSLIKNELNLIKNYNPNRIAIKLRTYADLIEKDKLNGIPLEPIEPILKKRAIDKETIHKKLREVITVQNVYHNAVKELEADEGIIGAGLTGEKNVNKELDMYKDMFVNIPNVRFEVDGQTVESDNIIISKKGIFTVEVKNFSPKGSYSLHLTKDGQWLKVLASGRTEPMKDVASQMNRHIAYKQRLINQEYKKNYGKTSSFGLHPIFVIANDKVRIENDSELPIMRISNIYHYIMKFPDILTDEQVIQIANIVRANSLPSKKYPLKLYHEGLKDAYDVLLQIESHIDKNTPFVSKYIDSAVKEITTNHLFK